MFPLQASLDSFPYVSTRLDQEGTIALIQLNVGVDDEEKTSTSEQAAARKTFARLPIGRQQQERVRYNNEIAESKQLPSFQNKEGEICKSRRAGALQ